MEFAGGSAPSSAAPIGNIDSERIRKLWRKAAEVVRRLTRSVHEDDRRPLTHLVVADLGAVGGVDLARRRRKRFAPLRVLAYGWRPPSGASFWHVFWADLNAGESGSRRPFFPSLVCVPPFGVDAGSGKSPFRRIHAARRAMTVSAGTPAPARAGRMCDKSTATPPACTRAATTSRPSNTNGNTATESELGPRERNV
jgi:hypothetical protein